LKIIIVNYRYFISGGPERYLFNIQSILEENGHEVIPFSIKSKRNTASQYENYFLDPIGDDEIYFKEYRKSNIKTVLKSLTRAFYSFEAERKLKALIKAVNPDLIYVLYYTKISTSIFNAAAKSKIPVVNRISDFGQICANGLFFRPEQKDICSRCLTGSKLNAIRYKCVHGSYLYSAIKVASLKFQEISEVRKKIQAFVIPSNFTLEQFKLSGVPETKLVHIPTFFNYQSVDTNIQISYEPFALYIGRIEPEKGLLTLVKAFENTTFNLKIIGFSNTGFEDVLKEYLKDKNHNIEFLGRKEFDQIQLYLSKCSFTIVPSEWYDNFPNTILESFAFKKCTIATDIGSLKEIVIDNETGLLFRIKDMENLKSKIEFLFANETICRKMGENAFDKLEKEYSAELHYKKLIKLFEKIVENY
jgi:glycosyltransferase involved in cell wall biosynthesis